MEIELDIDDWDDKVIAKTFLQMAFNKEDKPFILIWQTVEGTIVTFSKRKDVLVEQLMKERYEEMLCNHGTDAIWEDVKRIINDVEEGN